MTTQMTVVQIFALCVISLGYLDFIHNYEHRNCIFRNGCNNGDSCNEFSDVYSKNDF